MSVSVELFGIPRQRVGAARISANANTLGGVLAELAERHPEFARDCVDFCGPGVAKLKSTCVANLGGNQFITDPQEQLSEDTPLLLLSADAGG